MADLPPNARGRMLAPMSSIVTALVVALWVTTPGEEPDPSTAEPAISSLRLETERVEPHAVERGLDLRIGPRWRRFTIEVVDGEMPHQVDVHLEDEHGRTHERTLGLMSQTIDDRSRELASALALIIDQLPRERPEWTPTPEALPPSETPSAPASPVPSGWVGVGPRVAFNPRGSADPDVGVSLSGGAWLVREYLQPMAELGWTGGSRGSLRLDAVRFGGGAAVGAPWAGGTMWSGAGALMRAQWSRATAAGVATGWWASPAVMATVQYRGRILVAGAWLGVDLSLPPLRAYDENDVMRWSLVRPMATVQIGLRLPPRLIPPRS